MEMIFFYLKGGNVRISTKSFWSTNDSDCNVMFNRSNCKQLETYQKKLSYFVFSKGFFG